MLSVDHPGRLKPQVRPFLHEGFDIPRVHGAITEQVVIKLDAPTDQALMVFQALLPAARVFLPDECNRYDEVAAFQCNHHGSSFDAYHLL